MSTGYTSDASRSGAFTDVSAVTTLPSTDPTSADYIFFGSGVCRFAYRSSIEASRSRAIVCGRPDDRDGVNGCKCSTHNNKAADRYRLAGYYLRVPLQRGGIICGLDEDPLAPSEYRELVQEEREETERELADARLAAANVNDSEEEDASQDPRPNPSARRPGVFIDPAANTSCPPAPQPSANQPPQRFVGHERADGERAFSCSTVNEERMCRHGWNSTLIFRSETDLQVWLDDSPANRRRRAQELAQQPSPHSTSAPTSLHPSESGSDSSSSSSHSDRRAKKKKAAKICNYHGSFCPP